MKACCLSITSTQHNTMFEHDYIILSTLGRLFLGKMLLVVKMPSYSVQKAKTYWPNKFSRPDVAWSKSGVLFFSLNLQLTLMHSRILS